jgi:hypothetical protein
LPGNRSSRPAGDMTDNSFGHVGRHASFLAPIGAESACPLAPHHVPRTCRLFPSIWSASSPP